MQLPLTFTSSRWKAILDPVIASPMVGVSVLEGITLQVGSNTIDHKLGQMQQGWFLTDINGIATVYRSAPFNPKTLQLTSSAVITVNIGVF